MKNLHDYYIGTQGRLITCALKQGDKYYNVLTIIEVFPKGMNIEKDFMPNLQGKVYCDRTKAPGNKDKVYFGVESITITKDLISDPQNHSRFNGFEINSFSYQFKEYTTNWIQLPDSSNEIASMLPWRMTSVKAYVFQPQHLSKDKSNILKDTKISLQLRELSVRNLGYDVTQHHSLYGSFIVALYTPVFQRIAFRSNPNRTGLFFRLDYRTALHPKLKFIIQTYSKENILLEYKIKDISGDFLSLIEFKHQFHHIDVSVENEFGIILDYYSHLTFIGSIHFTTSMKSKDVKYVDRKENSKTVEKFTKDSTTVIGKEETPQSLFDSTPEFTYDQFERSLDFIFFDGDKDNIENNVKRARECILRILNTAHDTCYVCDIFFSAKTFASFLFDLKNLDTNVRIITSKENLDKSEQKNLANLIKQANDEIGHNIECRLLRGDKASLHDRMIIADNNVWMIGCSLDEFGVRATTLIRVPQKYAPKIIEGVSNWWNDDNLTENLQ